MINQGPVSTNDIVAATSLSPATIDRVLNKRPGVHPRTQAEVLRVLARMENDGLARTFCPRKARSHRFGIVVQAGTTFTRSVLDTVQKMKEAEIGVYNVAGGNFGLAGAIDGAQLVRRPLYIAHEVNGLPNLCCEEGSLIF